MKGTALITVLCLLSFSASAKTPVMINGVDVFEYGNGCTVTVYQTEDQARKNGNLVEVCIVDGTSSMSFSHTPETAIKKHAKKACKCGVDKVYVQSRSKMGMGVATVSMVGFKWANGLKQNIESDNHSYIDELKALGALKDDGIISEEEFQKQKAEILARD